MNIINISKVSNTIFNQQPYAYAKISSVFNEGWYQQLCNEYPTADFNHCETLGKEKSYSMYMRQLFDTRCDDQPDFSSLSMTWQQMLSELVSPAYIDTMSQHVGRDLHQCDIEVNCWRYLNGCWLSPHTDKEEKVVSQLFYFNEHWDRAWGGGFRVLNSNNNEDLHDEIFPKVDTSIILIRSDKSWHSVAPLTCPDTVSRKLLQIIFWNKNAQLEKGMY